LINKRHATDFSPYLSLSAPVGKTTFTKLLTGDLKPTNGDIELGETIVIGNYDQLGLKFDETAESQTVLEFVVDQVAALDATGTGMSQTPAEARRLLNQFEFPRTRWNERVSVLSGGERRRLQLLSVLSKKPNFLILDEPSVDCDLDTLSAVEAYLDTFEGVLVVVSHDRAFADKVTEHLFIFEGNGIVKDFQGSLSEYATVLVDMETKKIEKSICLDATLPTDSKKESYKLDREGRNQARNLIRSHKKEMLNLERALERLKTKATEVQNTIDDTSSDEGWSVLAELTGKLNAINEEADEKEMRWLEIAEELEALEANVA
jgi:ABC transport system ATP-binding/permease protein